MLGLAAVKIVLRSLPQMVVMATVVNMALFLPVGGALALAAFLLFGVPLQAFVSFGGEVPAFDGVVIWWGVLLVPSLVYAAYMMPWAGKDA